MHFLILKLTCALDRVSMDKKIKYIPGCTNLLLNLVPTHALELSTLNLRVAFLPLASAAVLRRRTFSLCRRSSRRRRRRSLSAAEAAPEVEAEAGEAPSPSSAPPPLSSSSSSASSSLHSALSPSEAPSI